jgi:hypothetical protein
MQQDEDCQTRGAVNLQRWCLRLRSYGQANTLRGAYLANHCAISE